MLIKDAAFVVTQNATREILVNTSIRVEGNSIVAIGALRPKKGEDVIDARESIVMPGLVNCHTHLGMSLLRGYSDDKELHAWLKDIISEEKRQSRDDIFEGALLGCEESLLFGTTTLLDMYTPAEPCARAAERSGIRAILCPAYFDAFMDTSHTISLREAWMERYAKHPRVRTGHGPHSIYGCSADLIKKVSAQAIKEKSIMTIHLAETRKERYDCQKANGKLPLQHLDSLGVLGPHCVLVHCVWLTKEEICTVAKTKTSVVHCPTSNMKLASGGSLALREMHEAHVLVALGTDSTASNNNLDMFSTMKMTALLHKHQYWDPALAPAQRVLDMATRDGAKALGMEKEIGSLETQKKADIVIIPIKHHMRPCTKERVVSHLVYAVNGSDVDTTIVDGIVRVRHGKIDTSSCDPS